MTISFMFFHMKRKKKTYGREYNHLPGWFRFRRNRKKKKAKLDIEGIFADPFAIFLSFFLFQSLPSKI